MKECRIVLGIDWARPFFSAAPSFAKKGQAIPQLALGSALHSISFRLVSPISSEPAPILRAALQQAKHILYTYSSSEFVDFDQRSFAHNSCSLGLKKVQAITLLRLFPCPICSVFNSYAPESSMWL